MRQAVVGGNHFSFTYNKEKAHYFGLLQGFKGSDGNLLCITGDGRVYSYLLAYRDTISKLNYFIDFKASIGREKPEAPIKIKPGEMDSIAYARFGSYLLKQKSKSPAVKRKHGLVLKLQPPVYHADQLYLVLEFNNRSRIDFMTDRLEVFRVSGNKKRKASYQKILMKQLFCYALPKIMKSAKTYRFICVVPKYAFGKNEHLEIWIKEKKGNRNIRLSYK